MPRPWSTAPRLRTWMLGMLTPRRPSASLGLAAAPRLDVPLGTDKRPATAVTFLSVLLSPAAAPWALSTSAESDSGLMEPVVSGVVRSTVGTDLLSALPVEETLSLGSDRLSCEIDEVVVSGASALAAAEGAPCLGSMLPVPSSPTSRRLSSEPSVPRATFSTVVVARVVPTPVGVAADAVPAAAVAPSNTATDTAAPYNRNLRMVLPRSTETTINPYFRRWASRKPWPTGVKSTHLSG